MPSFQLSVTPNRRAAARFVAHVRRSIQKALAESPDKKQTDIARALGVHRSVINREIRGHKDMTLGRVAELAWALGRDVKFELVEPVSAPGQNIPLTLGNSSFVVSNETTNDRAAHVSHETSKVTVP